jgi:adenine-specific DNA-methyltransferase
MVCFARVSQADPAPVDIDCANHTLLGPTTNTGERNAAMPELDFKGKEFVYNHHLAVPHRPLLPDAGKSIGEVRLDGNLLIHGDNLHALKSLLPMYAGKVDCIFIDPPYNTGNEGWCYNDNVNSPMMQAWLKENPVGIEDGLRHDKWCAMMWPRLRLLYELMNERASIWITLDDNEIHRARMMLDEIFGIKNFVIQIEWQKRYTRSNNTMNFTSVIDHILVYQKTEQFQVNLTERGEEADARFSNPDNDPRGPWKATPFLNQVPPEKRRNLTYPITNPNTGRTVFPDKKAWRNDQTTFERLKKEQRFWWGVNGDRDVPDIKSFLSEVIQGLTPINLWGQAFAGNPDNANEELKQIFGDKVFDTPKPRLLLQRIIEHATDRNSLILDSFAGSGTTAQAVLEANQKDGGNRQFILVECEDYADTLTAERVRRVINGYAFTGTQREELLNKSLTFTDLKKADKLLDQIAAIENLDSHRFDKVEKKVKDGVLIVEGIKASREAVEGVGGVFTYCTLGDAIEMDKLLTGEALPDFAQLGALLFYMASSEVLASPGTLAPDKDGLGYLGESSAFHMWLIYKPELDFLRSRDAALTLTRARSLVEAKPLGKRHLVFAPAKFVSQKLLDAEHLPVEFSPLPWALYRVERA